MGFISQEKKELIIIAGCGRLGSSLASMLSDQNKSVTIIDHDETSFRKLSPSYGGLALEGNAEDTDILNEAEIDEAAAVIAVTDFDDVNIMISLIAKQIYHVEKVVARIKDTSKQIAFQDLGINSICPELLSIKEFECIMLNTEVTPQ